MSTETRELMLRLGVPDDAAEALEASLANPPAGTFEVRELEAADETRLALLLSILAAADLRRCGEALDPLLQRVSAAREGLSAFDRGRHRHLQGVASWRLRGSLFAATAALNQSVKLLLEAGTAEARAYLARVFDTTGIVLQKQGLLSDARCELERALRYRDPESDAAGTALTLGNLGRLCMDLGDFEAAEGCFERDLEIVSRLGPERTAVRAQILSHLGTCALERGRPKEARARFAASAELAGEDGDEVGLAFAILGQASVALHDEDLAEVGELLGEARNHIETQPAQSALRHALDGLAFRLEGQRSVAEGRLEMGVSELRLSRESFVLSGVVSPVEKAKTLRELASALFATGRRDEAVLVLRDALRSLDATAADSLRADVEAELQARSRDSWLLHAAGRFLGQEQIDFLLREAGRGGFRGTSEEVAILFSDIRGFTAFSERLAPEDLVVFLNDYLGHMTRCIEYCDGRVDKFIGDAVMALFSLPRPREDDAERAALAALMMQAELERFNRKMPAGTPELRIGVGLHLGPVVAGLIGSPQKRSYTVIGDAVNTASRLEGMTKQLGASILVSSEIYQRFPDPERFWLRPLGRYCPKGRGAAVEVAELVGEVDRSTVSRRLREEIEEASTALALFEERRFEEARDAYRALELRSAGTRRVVGYTLLATEAERAHRLPPPPEWAGEIVLTAK
jgi:class 3 adenylate cyclase